LGIVERALDHAGFVVGPELIKLAFRIVSNLRIHRVARPHLEWLAREIGENVYLGVQNGLRAIYIDKVEGTESVRVNVELASTRPLHSTAIGKLILAFSPPSLLDTLLRMDGLPAVTPATITAPARLRLELAEIRKRGFSTSDGENIEGIYSIAAPVIARHRLIAGVCVATPRSRGLRNRDRWARKMRQAAGRISRDIPAQPQPSTARPLGLANGRAEVENDYR
jgi:DNA-binding IclR family transcriptional regulator